MKPNQPPGLTRLFQQAIAPTGEPKGEHLTDDEIGAYADNSLTPERVGQLDLHLASCPECAVIVEALLTPGPAPTAEQQRRHRQSFEVFLKQLVQPEKQVPAEASCFTSAVRSKIATELERFQKTWLGLSELLQRDAYLWATAGEARSGAAGAPSDVTSDGFQAAPFYQSQAATDQAPTMVRIAVHLKRESPDLKLVVSLEEETPVPASLSVATTSWRGSARFNPVSRSAILVIPGNEVSDWSELRFEIDHLS